MKKKAFCTALALCMVFVLAACGGPASDPDASASPGTVDTTPFPDGSTPTDLLPSTVPTPTPEPEEITTLRVNGITFIRDGQITGLGLVGMLYEDGKLTITDVTYQNGRSDSPLVYFEGGDLEIVVEGESTLASDNGMAVFGCPGDESVNISGSGTLHLSAAGGAAFDIGGDLTVGCALDAVGEGVLAVDGAVSAAEGFAITAQDDANFTVAPA